MYRLQLIFVMCVLTVLVFFSSLVSAADLRLEVDEVNKLVNIKNSLPNRVTLLFLVDSNQRRLPLFSKTAPYGSSQVPLRFEVPEKIGYAVCEMDPPPSDIEKARDDYYHLSVEVEVLER